MDHVRGFRSVAGDFHHESVKISVRADLGHRSGIEACPELSGGFVRQDALLSVGQIAHLANEPEPRRFDDGARTVTGVMHFEGRRPCLVALAECLVPDA